MRTKPLLTIGEVIKRPLFAHSQVVAGNRGLSRTIRWVHVLEAAENASFLKGGELILSTGVGFGEKTQKHLFYLEEVIRRKAAGLCIELGQYIPRIPVDMIELANHHGFPLIVFDKPVHFVDITMDLHEHIINLHNKALRQLEDYSRDLQKLTLKTHSLPRILLHFQGMTHSQAFLYSLDNPSLCAPNMPQTVQREMSNFLRTSLLSIKTSPDTHGFLTISQNKQILYQPIVAMGNVLAYLCVIAYSRQRDELLNLTLDYTATAIAQILLRTMFARERAYGNENRLLEDILQGKAAGAAQLQETLGLSASTQGKPCWAVILRAQRGESTPPLEEGDSPFHDMLVIFRAICNRRGFRPLLYSKGSHLYLLLLGSHAEAGQRQNIKETLDEIEKSCRQVFGSAIALVMGASTVSLDQNHNIRHAFMEAEQVLALGAGSDSPFFSDLGVYRLLLQHKDSKALSSFVEDYLGGLLEHDSQHGTKLLQTLQTYLESGLNKQEAADRLFIHRQTLYHRLGKIETIIGDDYLKPQKRLSLEMALQIHCWLK